MLEIALPATAEPCATSVAADNPMTPYLKKHLHPLLIQVQPVMAAVTLR